MEISLEEFSSVVAAIHAAAASPERWPDAFSAVARLVDSSEANLDVMALLAPHFEAARQVQTRLAEALPGRLALASLDRLAVAAFILNGAGAVHHLNASARSLLAHDRCALIRNARFRFQQNLWNKPFETALRKATQSPPRSSVLPLSAGEKESYEVTVSPLQGDHVAPCASPSPLALVVIARPRLDGERIVRRVRPLYGLTEAEARVMAALALGATVDEIALTHGVCTSTVRAQVRSIFEKTGVNRQSDLVRLALTGARIAVDVKAPLRDVAAREIRVPGGHPQF